jgi:predicted permease
MDGFRRDLIYGLRALRANPGATAAAVLALALGIGVNTAVFSLAHAALLRPLPHLQQPDRLVQIWGSTPEKGIPYHNVTYSDAVDWRRRCSSLAIASAAAPGSANLTGGFEPERVLLWRVNASFFPMLGVRMQRGRGFLPEEDQPGGPAVTVITHELWRRRFGADPELLGRAIRLDGESRVVVGILPPGFELPGRKIDLFVPLALSEARSPQNDGVSVTVFARLRPGVTLAQAQAEMDAIGRALEREPRSLGRRPRVWGLREFVVRDLSGSLRLLAAAAALVLLLACADVAGLLLAQAWDRRREWALRSALGARGWDLLRQSLVESTLLSLAAAAVGLPAACAALKAIPALAPARYPLLEGAAVSGRAPAFTLALTLGAGLALGLGAAAAAARTGSLAEALRQGSRGSGAGRSQSRLLSALVVGEAALALVLLAGAGLALGSFARLSRVDPGFDPHGVLAANITLGAAQYGRPESRVHFWSRLLEQLESDPAVAAAGLVTSLPLTHHNTGTGLLVEGRPTPREGATPIVWFRAASPGYFRAMLIPLRRGRLLSQADDERAAPVALINETLARRYWPGEDPIGKRFTNSRPRPGEPPRWFTVVGVVGDVRHKSLTEPPDAELFWSYRQAAGWLGSAWLVVRSRAAGGAAGMAPLLRRAVRAIDRGQSLSQVRTLEEIVASAMAPQRLAATLMAGFAGIALALAAMGTYGLLSYWVTRRRPELGLRLALGAPPGSLHRKVVGQGMKLAAAGAALGLAGSAALGRLAESLFYGVSAAAPFLLAAAALALETAAALAAWIPARRAAAVDPMAALRCE